VNTPHLLTKHLPAYLSTSNNLNPNNLPIRILNPTSGHDKYVRTKYAYVWKFIKDVWDEYADIVDAVIHTGMAGPWTFYSVEERAFREGVTSTWWPAREEKEGYYMRPDDAGETVKYINDEGGERLQEDMPLDLAPKFNVQKVVADAMSVVNLQEKGTKLYKCKLRRILKLGSIYVGFSFMRVLLRFGRGGWIQKWVFVMFLGGRIERGWRGGGCDLCYHWSCVQADSG
jgi:hypothetical protein